jgi:LPS sulfotransferase NodH
MLSHRCYIVAATYRSGSSLLCDALEATGLAGAPKEFFHPLNEPPAALEKYLEFVRGTIRDASTPNGVFGVKLLWHHVAYLRDKTRGFPEFRGEGFSAFQTISTLFGNPRYVHIARRDKLAQAISLARARQTGVFHRFDEESARPIAEPVFDVRTIEWYLHKSRLDDLAWRAFFDSHGVTPFVVEYETFLTRREETIREILDFLGIPVLGELRLPEPRLKRTSDGLNAEWRRRFLELRPGARTR